MMDKSKDDYGSKYLYAEDLLCDGQYSRAEVTIYGVHPAGTLTKADGKPIDKPAIEFVGKAKKLVLCKSNVAFLKYATGESSPSKWIGKKIILTVRSVDAFGDRVPAIRIWPNTAIRKGLVKYLGDEIKNSPMPVAKVAASE